MAMVSRLAVKAFNESWLSRSMSMTASEELNCTQSRCGDWQEQAGHAARYVVQFASTDAAGATF